MALFFVKIDTVKNGHSFTSGIISIIIYYNSLFQSQEYSKLQGVNSANQAPNFSTSAFWLCFILL